VISGLPYYCNVAVAEAARGAGAHYFDLTEDVEVTRAVIRIAAGAPQAFVPQCGLAPGFVSIAANELMSHFDKLRAVKLRVGALPQHPNNVLKYSLTWSTEGLINEYGNPCQAIADGRTLEVAPLEGLEEIEIDGTLYEAFNTSGGLGTLCETLEGKVRNLNYRTIRYPGHAAIMKALLSATERPVLTLTYVVHGNLKSSERRSVPTTNDERSRKLRAVQRHSTQLILSKRRLLRYAAREEQFGIVRDFECAQESAIATLIAKLRHVLSLL